MGFDSSLGKGPKSSKHIARAKERKALMDRDAAPKLPLPSTNPLDDQVDKGLVTGKIDVDDKAESKTVLNLLQNSDGDAQRIRGNGYWVCLVFPDEDTCEKFMELSGWQEHTADGAYVDGLAIAQKLGIQLPAVKPLRFKSRRADKRLIEEVGAFVPKSKKGKVP